MTELVQCDCADKCGEAGCIHHGPHNENDKCYLPGCIWTDTSGETAKCIPVVEEEGGE